MTPYTFDTLGASKQLREAGMAEGVAEAVVAVFQRATSGADFSQLATSADVADMATKADIATIRADMATNADIAAIRGDMATKADIAAIRADMATQADIADMATKSDLELLQAAIKRDLAVQAGEARLEMVQLELRAQRRSDQQMWGIIGLLSGVIMLATTVIKLFP